MTRLCRPEVVRSFKVFFGLQTERERNKMDLEKEKP
jgi:hypothetical protein